MRRWARVAVCGQLLAACTGKPAAPTGPSPAVQPVPAVEPAPAAADAASAAETAEKSPEEVRAPEVSPRRCTSDAAGDEAWRAFAALLAELPVPQDFVCPASYRLVQRRPWVEWLHPFERPPAWAQLGEMVTFAGTEATTGDALWATLARTRKPMADEHARSNMQSRIGDPQCQVTFAFGDRWLCATTGVRRHGAADPLRAWLTAHPGVKALDWVALKLPLFRVDEVDWGRQPRVLHVHEERAVTVCEFVGEAADCRRRDGVERSVLADGGYVDEVGLVLTVDGEQEERVFAPTEPDELEENDPWIKVPPPQGLVEHYRDRFIGMIDGAVVLGRYEELGGDAAIDVDTVTEWVLTRAEAWTATPVPDGIVDSVIPAGDALGLVVSLYRLGDGPSSRRRELRTFAAGPRGPEFAGQLAGSVGGTENGWGGDYSWQYTVAARGPGCLTLGAGPVSGEYLRDPNTDREQALPLAPRMPAVFKQLAGDWRITADGPQRGCRVR